MGEAKRNLERVRERFIAEAQAWNFPPSQWEANIVAEIEATPFWTVRRYPPEVLERMGMPPRECHANAKFMADNDPEKLCRHVTGWWHQDGTYVLHSIVERGDIAFCVTPSLIHDGPTIEFIPDPKIIWREEGEFRVAYRDGKAIGPGVRSNPTKSLSELDHLLSRLSSGMNPYKAVQKDN